MWPKIFLKKFQRQKKARKHIENVQKSKKKLKRLNNACSTVLLRESFRENENRMRKRGGCEVGIKRDISE